MHDVELIMSRVVDTLVDALADAGVGATPLPYFASQHHTPFVGARIAGVEYGDYNGAVGIPEVTYTVEARVVLGAWTSEQIGALEVNVNRLLPRCRRALDTLLRWVSEDYLLDARLTSATGATLFTGADGSAQMGFQMTIELKFEEGDDD